MHASTYLYALMRRSLCIYHLAGLLSILEGSRQEPFFVSLSTSNLNLLETKG